MEIARSHLSMVAFLCCLASNVVASRKQALKIALSGDGHQGEDDEFF